jgi:predicted 3-demethylubiquinone-9 3-methyltransferase (glyoxalase superfamily)
MVALRSSLRVNNMKNITPCLWFDSNAEEAVNFYISIFEKA